MKTLLRGAYDLHLHCSPDVVPRAQDLYDLAIAAEAAEMAGIGLKDHTTSTVGRCHALNRQFPKGPRFFSAIALNPPLGGLNPSAVQAAMSSGVDIVYLPTYSAAHHIETLGKDVTPVPHPESGPEELRVTDSAGNVVPEVQAIVRMVAAHDAVLATGHVSPAESLATLQFARAMGVRRLVVTHASQSVPDMSVDDQLAAVELGAMIEHCFLAVTDCCPAARPIEILVEQIRAVGPEHVILSSDFGQPANGPPIEAFGKHVGRLMEFGFDPQALQMMLCDNPRRIVENRNGGSL